MYASCAACGRSLYQVHDQMLLCTVNFNIWFRILLVFPNDSYYIITALDLSTAFFNFFVIEFLSHFRLLFKI